MRKILKGLIIAGFCALSCSNLVYAGTSKATSSDAPMPDFPIPETKPNQNKINAKKWFDIINQYDWKPGKDTNLSIPHTEACPPEKAIDYLYDFFPDPYDGIEVEMEYVPILEELGGIAYEEPFIGHLYDKNGKFVKDEYYNGYGVIKYEILDSETSQLYYFGGIMFDIYPVLGFSEEKNGTIYQKEENNKRRSNRKSHKKYLNPSVYGGTWVRDGGSWKLRNSGKYAKSQWAFVNEKWYLFGTDGYMLTGWQKANEKWYLLGADGAMLTGWQKTGDKWYYLTENGDMLASTVTPDGYSVDSNGAWIE